MIYQGLADPANWLQHGVGLAHSDDAMVSRQTIVSISRWMIQYFLMDDSYSETDVLRHPDKNFSTHRLLLGTHTSKEAPNYIQIAHVQLPNPATPDRRDYDEDREEIGGYGNSTSTGKDGASIKFNIVQKIDHPGEVNKARYMPQNPNMIATMCVDGRAMIWDKTKHTSVPNGTANPQIELVGHKQEGFGLNWSGHEQGHLATGSEDKTVRLW